MHQMVVLICASTAIRASEACGLKWRDIIWDKNQIKIERRWTAACIDKPKTKASKAPVALSPQLAWFLRQWRCITPYAQDEDWVFPSFKIHGKIPMCAGIFVTDHLRPAALAAGIQIGDGQRFGLHSLRSSMATWMVSIDKTDVKTAQGNMRHAGPEIMLRKYAQVVIEGASNPARRFLGLQDTADRWGISMYGVRRQVEAGAIRAINVGARILIPIAEIERIEREGVGNRRCGRNLGSGNRESAALTQ